jgi:hypothetical protein
MSPAFDAVENTATENKKSRSVSCGFFVRAGCVKH